VRPNRLHLGFSAVWTDQHVLQALEPVGKVGQQLNLDLATNPKGARNPTDDHGLVA
jgi:hypothetical protein